MTSESELASAIESILLVAAEPVTARSLARLLEVEGREIEAAVDFLTAGSAGRGIQVQNHSGKLQLVTAPENAEIVRRFLNLPTQPKLSRPALETLAIIAYRQPVTRGHIEQIRGVNADRIIVNLATRGWIEETGRQSTPGRPVEYGTTSAFLDLFGLVSLSELPALEHGDEGLEQLTILGLKEAE